MNTTTLNIIKKLSLLSFLMLIVNVTESSAQVSDWGNIYVHDGGQMHIVSGPYTFQSPLVGTQTSTTRTASTYGKISFANAITTTTGSGTARFVDGYVRKYGMMALTYPIGQGTTFAPVKTTPTTVDGVDAAYYLSNGTASPRTGTLEAALGAISTIEYFHILRASGSSSNANITLSWRAASGISTLTSGSLSDLTIAGWDGSGWVMIPSVYDTTNVFNASATTLTAGSITSTSSVDLGTYQFFTFAAKSSCQPLVTVVPANATTWNGTSWSNGVPGLNAAVTLTGNFSGNLTCNSLAMGAFNVTLADGELLEVVNGVTGTGKILMSSEASFVQRANIAGTANIELTKVSRLMHWRDYMYYGTPIAGNFISQLISNTWNDNITGTTGSFDINDPIGYGGPWKYIVGGGGWNALNTGAGIVTGKGFIARIKGNLPWNGGNATAAPSPAVTPTATGKVNFKFAGVANNGNIVVPVTVSTTQFELLANPYPSAVDAQKFLLGNPNLDGALYFWSANTPRLGTAASTQTYANTGDYSVWTLAGATNASATNTSVAGNPAMTPDGKIASAQGFRVRAATAGTTATFTNCMRLTAGNNTFFRSSAVNRYKMNIQDNGGNNYYSQMIVAYIPGATNDYDRMYDGEIFSSSPVKLYTIMPNAKKLAINARPSFVDSDVVPLGFGNTTADQSFTISIEDLEGIFATNSIDVYIHDKLDNSYHNMDTPFTFNGNGANTLDTRFEIVYQRSSFSTTDFLANSVIVNVKNNVFTASANEIGMTEIEIFDMTGRKIQTYDAYNKSTITESFVHAEAIYIAKVKLSNGSIATQKLINKK